MRAHFCRFMGIAVSLTMTGISLSAEVLQSLTRSGRFWRADDGRTTILRGVDYAYNFDGYEKKVFELTDADLDRIAGWGMNTLRIRIRDFYAGYFPTRQPESWYFPGLDDLIARANDRGLYVIIASAGPANIIAQDEHPNDPLFDQAKFFAGNPARAHWLSYLEAIFRRYADHPGVIAFDPLNEEISFPPGVHEREFMGPAHRDALARLRTISSRHVYIQQAEGWAYQGHPIVIAHNPGDANRFYSPKWNVQSGGSPPARFSEMLTRAAEAGVPLFLTEWGIIHNPELSEESNLELQRIALGLMDKFLVGGVRLGYTPSVDARLITDDREEVFWIRELVRPYPIWTGGEVTRIAWDFDSRRFEADFNLNGSGQTEIFASVERTYRSGFVVETSRSGKLVHDGHQVREASGGLGWDAVRQRVVIPGLAGELTVTIVPHQASRRRPARPAAGSSSSKALQKVSVSSPAGPATANTTMTLLDRITLSGHYTPGQAQCIEMKLRQTLPSPELSKMLNASGVLDYRMCEPIGQAVYDCVQ